MCENGMPDDVWTPFKHLQAVVEASLIQEKSNLSQLELTLRKSKQYFTSLLKNPQKNEKSRQQIRQGTTDGVNIPGSGHVVLSKDLVDETIIISDMYNLDEFNALELLCTAQQQMGHHPGLPRGLVAILLYYDGRKALVSSLRDLFQARNGVSWCTEASKDIVQFITNFTDSLVNESNLLLRVIELLGELDISKEMANLTSNRALGPPKHHRQVLDLFEDIRIGLATTIFNWSAQCGLPSNCVKKLVFEYFEKYKPTDPRGGIDDVSMILLMALLYSFDTSVLQRHEDIEVSVQNLPIIKEDDYANKVFNALHQCSEWEWDSRIKSIILFGFGLSIATLRHAPQSLKIHSEHLIEKDLDEELIDEAMQLKVFDFIHNYLLESKIIFKTEFFYRKVHTLFTDFIDYMHSKVTELRGRADETARTVQAYNQQGIDPPPNLDHSFESLMMAVGKFYAEDKLKLKLCMEYWGPMEMPSNYTKTTSRSVSLFKFIRLAGELLPPILFVPYIKMLSGLSSCDQSARNTFNLLKQGSSFSGSATLSWDHFFGSLGRYYANLRQEQAPGIDTVYRSRILNRSINPQEIEGLQVVLQIIRVVATFDEVARIALCEQPNWAPIQVLLGLLTCSVPIDLKADILLTLAALGKSKDTAIQIWNNLEASQIIRTVPTTTTYLGGGLEAEIEQNECRNEFYPLSKAILDLLYSLSTTVVPKSLGNGPRRPGLDPYLTFLIDVIFLKFYNRNYKNIVEKWEVCEKSLRLLNHFLSCYEINPTDFIENREENSPPGYHIMIQLNTKSDTLRLILHILDETRNSLDTYAPFLGKERLENCALLCLNMLEKSLSNQDLFFDAHSVSNSSILLSGLNKLILDVNPRSGKPDHILNSTKFVTYSWLPQHALVAVNILNIAARQPNISGQILGMFTQSERIQMEIRHGFVEWLESPTAVVDDSDETQLDIKQSILCLLMDCLAQPTANIALYLLGFDVTKDARPTQLGGKQASLTTSSSCAKSLVALLDGTLDAQTSGCEINKIEERITEKAYELLYKLCLNQKTSQIVLRFLRSCNDFLCRHLSSLPFKHFENGQVLNQMSYLLKCIAIELKITADGNQVTQFSNLCKILLGNIVHHHPTEAMPLELSNYISVNETMFSSLNKAKLMDQSIVQILICHLLDCLEFEVSPLTPPKWDFFDNALTGQILQECEIKNPNGPKLINIKKLHGILADELNTVQSTIAAGQRQLILQEIESVLKFALRVNEQKLKRAATIRFMESWGQVTEVLFSVAPVFSLSNEIKQELILEILQCILSKIVPVQVAIDLANVGTSTVLILLVKLRACYEHIPTSNDLGFNGTSIATANSFCETYSQLPKSNTLSLKFILQHIIEWIQLSGATSQKLRINLYASLLNFLHIVKGNCKGLTEEQAQKEQSDFFVSRLDRSMSYAIQHGNDSNQIQMAIEVITSFGEKLFDILCHDCIGGHDICKMLALSCIDRLLDLDSFTNFINFIAKRGYLSHLIDSLLKSDHDLCSVLKNIPENMRSLYVYESKMATLSRIAGSYIGAELLLENKILGVLSSMKVFDLHPDFQVNIYGHQINSIDHNSFVPPVETRYQQILFPALNLCDCLISTLGPENLSAISQVLHFLMSHCETIELVLRTGNPCLRIGLLKELSGITGLIARTANQQVCALKEVYPTQELSAHSYRLQRLMLSLFPRFILSESILREMFKQCQSFDEYDKTLLEKTRAMHVISFMETAANLSLYCRNAIANHTADHRTTQILFSPSITEVSLQRTDLRGSNTLEISPSLGIVMNQLKCSVEHYNREKVVYEKLQRQKCTLPNINLDATAHNQHLIAKEQLNDKQAELNLCSFITEQCLYLLWSHLDFYMKRAIPINTLQFNDKTLSLNNDTFISSSLEAGWKISSADISRLKKSLIAVFNETFSKQLIATTQSQSVTDKSFTEGLLRRIKSLIQFVPVEN